MQEESVELTKKYKKNVGRKTIKQILSQNSELNTNNLKLEMNN